MHYRILILLFIPLPLLAKEDGVETMVVGFLVGTITALLLATLKWVASDKPSLKKIISDSENSIKNRKSVKILKKKLKGIELQITSFQEIKKTGKITTEEEDSWLNLAREHKNTTDEIRSLLMVDDSKGGFKNIIQNKDFLESEKINEAVEEIWVCTDCKEENPLTFETCWKCLRNKNNPLK